MDWSYREVVKEYLNSSSQVRNKLTVLSGTVIAAIYFFLDKQNAALLKLAFFFMVFTIFIEIVGGYLKLKHYDLWIDGTIKSVDYRDSFYGALSEPIFWIAPLSFLFGSISFFLGILI